MVGLSLADGVVEALEAIWVERLETQVERMILAAWKVEETEVELEVSLRLCDDREIRELNREYRHQDRPTDVLAFSQREGEGAGLCPEVLGDIVISVETAKRQAKVNLYEEVIHLTAHGLCHLLGYDHRDDVEEKAMNERMRLLIEQSLSDSVD